ncbi:MAG TPA: hypothetical protein VF407_18010 [Polyangiaceae bacterium]
MPIQTVVMIVAALGFALVFAIYGKKRQAQLLAENTDKTAGGIAQKLGLSVLEGDPSTNFLYLMQPGRGSFERVLRLSGAPQGRQVDFFFTDGRKIDNYIVAVRRTNMWGCELSVVVNANVPDFEIVLRQPPQYLEPHRLMTDRKDLVMAATGQPQLDQTFWIAAADPRVAQVLAPALPYLASFAFVHVVGSQGRLTTFFTQFGLPYFSAAPETFVYALDAMACVLEGRPLPMPPNAVVVPSPR